MEAEQTPTTVHRMKGLDVRYISLCHAGKNGRSIIAKGEGSEALPEGAQLVEKSIQIRKSDEAKRMVYGVVYAPESVDADGHVASADEIEKAMHGFMQNGRVGQIDTNHDEQTGVGYVAESWLTKANDAGAVVDALFPDEPAGTWAVGIKVADDESWQKVEKGELGGLSLAGVATLEAETVEKAGSARAAEPERADAARGFVERVKVLLGLGPEAAAGTSQAAPAEPVPVSKDRLAEFVDTYIPTPDRQTAPAMMAALLAQMLAGSTSAGAPQPAAETDPNTTPKGVAKADLAKGFKERMLRSQMWRVSEALTDGIRDVLDDDDVSDKAAGVRAVVAEFEAWLTSQMGAAGAATAVEMAKGSDGLALALIPDDLIERVDRLEKATPGRGSVLGGADFAPTEEGPRGLRIV